MKIKYSFFQRVIVLFLMFVLMNLPALAVQESPKRIQLKVGSRALLLKGSVTKDKEVVYTFDAKAGQKFSGQITQKQGNIGFEVTGPDGEGLPEEEYDFNTKLTGTLEKTGTYKIIVATFETKPSRYTLSVKLIR